MTTWQRLIGLLRLDKRDIFQVFYYAIFAGVVNLSLPLGIQAIINLLQGAQISTSWIVLVVLVTIGVAFVGILQLMQIRIIEIDKMLQVLMKKCFCASGLYNNCKLISQYKIIGCKSRLLSKAKFVLPHKFINCCKSTLHNN